jgi:hypothetical protein
LDWLDFCWSDAASLPGYPTKARCNNNGPNGNNLHSRSNSEEVFKEIETEVNDDFDTSESETNDDFDS